jgi:hypothetical protein
MVDPEKQRPERLVVVHVCQKCDSASNPPEINEDVNVTGELQLRNVLEAIGNADSDPPASLRLLR